MLCFPVFSGGLLISVYRPSLCSREGFWRETPSSGAGGSQCWEQPLQVKNIINKQIVGKTESATQDRRGSGRALSRLLLLSSR